MRKNVESHATRLTAKMMPDEKLETRGQKLPTLLKQIYQLRRRERIQNLNTYIWGWIKMKKWQLVKWAEVRSAMNLGWFIMQGVFFI
jgi:hypothetical protein